MSVVHGYRVKHVEMACSLLSHGSGGCRDDPLPFSGRGKNGNEDEFEFEDGYDWGNEKERGRADWVDLAAEGDLSLETIGEWLDAPRSNVG
jgi:hypothetical protein